MANLIERPAVRMDWTHGGKDEVKLILKWMETVWSGRKRKKESFSFLSIYCQQLTTFTIHILGRVRVNFYVLGECNRVRRNHETFI